MSRRAAPDAYRLTNMRIWGKLIASLAIAFGVALFLGSWGIAKMMVGWLFAHDATMYEWATQLADVAWGHPMVFSSLLLAHYSGLAIIFAVSQFLFRRTTMRRLHDQRLHGRSEWHSLCSKLAELHGDGTIRQTGNWQPGNARKRRVDHRRTVYV